MLWTQCFLFISFEKIIKMTILDCVQTFIERNFLIEMLICEQWNISGKGLRSKEYNVYERVIEKKSMEIDEIN